MGRVGGGRREEVWEETRRVTKMQGDPNLGLHLLEFQKSVLC